MARGRDALRIPISKIVDAVSRSDLARGTVSLLWSSIIGKPTTLAGYGITDGVSTSRTISTTAPLTGGGDLSANRTLAVSTMVGDSGAGGARGVVPAPAAGDATKFLRGDGTWAAGGSGAPTTAEYLLKTADGSLPSARVVTNSATVTADYTTPAQVAFVRAAITGDVSVPAGSNTATLTTSVYATTILFMGA